MNVILKIGLIFNLGYLVKQFKDMNMLTTKMFNIFHYICVCFFVSFYFVCDHAFTFSSHGPHMHFWYCHKVFNEVMCIFVTLQFLNN
jgi:hypothetical protein